MTLTCFSTRLSGLAACLVAGLLLATGGRPVGAEAPRPNVIVVLADDLGWMDSRVYGSRYYETPSLERLAARGLRFTEAYASSPLCSPTRASVLTGQWPGRLRFTTPVGHLPQVVLDPQVPDTGPPHQKALTPASRTRLPNELVTYAELIQPGGGKTRTRPRVERPDHHPPRGNRGPGPEKKPELRQTATRRMVDVR